MFFRVWGLGPRVQVSVIHTVMAIREGRIS